MGLEQNLERVLMAIARTRHADARWDASGSSEHCTLTCWRGEWPACHSGRAVLTYEDLRRRRIETLDDEAMYSFCKLVIDMAYRNAGPPLWSNIPFRIGAKSPKRLQVAKERQ